MADVYVRLVERTLLAYEAGRVALHAFLAEGGNNELLEAQDSLESCVQLLNRAIRYFDQLRGMGFVTADELPFIPRPRELPVLSKDIYVRA